MKLKQNLLLLGVLFSCAGSAVAASTVKTLNVGAEPLALSIADFTPVTTVWAGREVVTGYEALIDVKGAKSNLFFNAQGEVGARWFASNFGLVTKVSCSGVPVGMSKVYGKRVDNISSPAQPVISELREGVENCSQLKVELLKEGTVSRQFYTRIQDISFTVSINAVEPIQGVL
ncbi:hypothetical protein JF50_21700 [Pseudoalteromonas luteoviolacea]|uniref:Uncharacterized protein n=1 Tax=Pseudoalteromonas luteoviolacea TaxID=43657 RepID=A0A0C1Q1Z0_9GAMM|nr:hypothetical protein [Pseudoalteromonas luteoviolacea]KID54546.1 hypothetical protein JF50_21700 [Pseudoalteromonas luteoviolacea]